MKVAMTFTETTLFTLTTRGKQTVGQMVDERLRELSGPDQPDGGGVRPLSIAIELTDEDRVALKMIHAGH